MYRKLHLFEYMSILSFSCLISCGKGKVGNDKMMDYPIASRVVTPQGDTLITCNFAEVKDTVELHLSTVVDSLEIIKLDKSLKGIRDVTIFGQYIGIDLQNKGPYHIFTREGKFVCALQWVEDKIYALADYQISEKSGKVYLLPWVKEKIMVFDLKGNRLQDIPLPTRLNKGGFVVDEEKRQVAVVQMAFEGENAPGAWLQDFEGKVIHQIKSSALEIFPDYSNEVNISVHGKKYISYAIMYPCIYNEQTDTLYHYFFDENILQPRLVINRDEIVGGASIHEFPSFYLSTVHEKDFKNVGTIYIDKKTLKGGRYVIKNDLLAGIPLDGMLKEEGFVAHATAAEWKKAVTKRLQEGYGTLSPEARAFLSDWQIRTSKDEDDFVYVFFGRYK